MFRQVYTRDKDVEERRDHPCYRNGWDGRLIVRSKTVQDSAGQYVPLLNTDGSAKLRADHYRRILRHEPWRVPLLYGRHMRSPNPDGSWEVKGSYSIYAIMCFQALALAAASAARVARGSHGVCRRDCRPHLAGIA